MMKLFKGLVLALAIAIPLEGQAAEFFPENGNALTEQEIASLRSSGEDLELAVGENLVVQDDMIFRESDLITTGFSGRKWSNGRFVYEFDANVSAKNRKLFEAACKVWEDVSAIQCVRRTAEGNYVHVLSSSYNRSYVGMVGGQQTLEIYNWGWKFIIAHEIGHALGLSHEQSRSDRDNYVEILFNNIVTGAASNFAKAATLNHTPYDFRSIMHYGPTAFTKNGGPTIQPKPGYENEASNMGNRTYLSAYDAAGMATQYGPN